MTIRLLLLLLTGSVSLTEAQPVVWVGSRPSANITRHVSVLDDPTGQLTIDQVSSADRAGQFRKSNKEILNFGFSETVRWLRLSVQNTTAQALFLELPQAFLPTADLYVRDGQGHWQVLRAGYKAGLYQKPVTNIYQVYPLPNTTADVYLRFLSYSQPFPVNLWNEQAFLVKANNQLLTYGLYVGLLLFVLTNNLFLFFSLRRFTYLLYAFTVFGYILNAANVMEGFMLYVFPQLDLRFWYMFTPMFTAAVTTLFGVQFLELKKYRPRLYRVGLGVVLFLLIYSFVCVSVIPSMLAEGLNHMIALAGLVFSATLGILAGRSGNRVGYPYAVIYTFFALFIFIEAFYIQTGYPPHLTEVSHVAIAMLLEALALAFLLSLRFEWERRATEQAKADAQHELLEKTHENEQILLAQNETLEREVAERTRAIEHKSQELEKSLQHLKVTQTQLIQSEKMASLGELTAGIAHEIQNPLNFVNNFAEVSAEMLGELKEEAQAGRIDEVMALADDLSSNLLKINHHGGQASSIVRGMLEHSRVNTGERQPTNLNALADEYLRLTYQGLRAKDKTFTCELVTDFDKRLGQVTVVPQDMGRVLLNLFNNAFYAVSERAKTFHTAAGPPAGETYQPMVRVSTRLNPLGVEIDISDNGTGIPDAVKEKIFQPFFTTKPTGKGTGLGLSLSYDIITKGHNGTLTVESTEGKGTRFAIQIPS